MVNISSSYVFWCVLGIAPVVSPDFGPSNSYQKPETPATIGSTLDPLEIFPSACDDQSKGDGPAARKLVPWLLMDPAFWQKWRNHEPGNSAGVLFGIVKWPFQGVKWPPTRGWKGHFESPGSYVLWLILLMGPRVLPTLVDVINHN